MHEIDCYDIVVAGGGPGGFAAAIAAARSGAKCVLLEREGCLGGAATTMLVNPFMSDRTSPGPDGTTRTTVNAAVADVVVPPHGNDRLARRHQVSRHGVKARGRPVQRRPEYPRGQQKGGVDRSGRRR